MKRTTLRILTTLVATGLLGWIPLAQAADHHGHQTAGKKAEVKPYPLDKCLVSGEKLGSMGEPHVIVHEGREIKFCCKGCVKDFTKNSAKYVAQVDTAWKKVKPYTLKTCLVSDEAFGGDMGEPYAFVHDGQEVRLCCKSCLKDFQKEPAKFQQKLKAASAKATGKD